ncbi:MAG: response regulator [Polyangiaceae bacterium]
MNHKMRRTSPATVLVVDDNAANRALAQGALEDNGYTVTVAKNGVEGLELFEKQGADCILLDVQMPELDGFEVCRRIRALPRGGDVPILFFTAYRDVDTFDKALDAGGDDFLTKPVRPSELAVRVQAALKLRRIKIDLREHYDLLKEQRDVLQRTQLQKERLTAFIVHDLKNPVATMDMCAQTLLSRKTLAEADRDSATTIRIEAQKLQQMILTLLDISKADEGKLVAKCAPLDLPAIVSEVLTQLALRAERRKVTLKSDVKVARANADADLLRRVLGNLLENAIRHTPTSSSVTVHAAEVEGFVELRVSDEGKGVPADMREKVFDPFVQVEAGTKVVAHGNRGLGLTFCKLAIEAHGGRIWVEDASPGAVFCLRLPIEQPA